MRLATFIYSVAIFFSFISCSLAGTIDPNTSDNKYIEYGSKFNYIVKICCFDGKGMACGSAVVIDSQWIITAAHVVEGCHSWTISINEEKYNLDKIISHPSYKKDLYGYHDIAIGHLEKPIDLDFYPELYDSEDEEGKICSIAGLGFTGTFHTGAVKHDGKKRAGSNYIDKIEKHVLICSPSRSGKGITELEFLICSGDSGGGLFIGNKLAGINSSVIGYDGKSNSTYGDESCHTRVSIYRKWILDTIKDSK